MKLRTETQDSEMMHEICIVSHRDSEMTDELKVNLEYLVNHINSLGKKVKATAKTEPVRSEKLLAALKRLEETAI